MWEAAVERSRAIQLQPYLLTTVLNGESREVGRTITSLARETATSGNPFKPPCALIAAGETAVRITAHNKGLGGANQELAAGFDDHENPNCCKIKQAHRSEKDHGR